LGWSRRAGRIKVTGTLALVTGASSGIGAATARELAREGARVLLLAPTREALDRVAREITDAEGSAKVQSVDLADAPAVQQAASAIQAESGTPDILVNGAGAGRPLFTEETSPAEAAQMIAVPYLGAFNLTRAFLPDMIRRRRGHIVNVSSVAAFFAVPGMTGYTAARWAMRPVAGMRRRACIATTARPADSTASASSVERDCSTVVISTSVTGGRQRPLTWIGVWGRTRVSGIGRTGYWPRRWAWGAGAAGPGNPVADAGDRSILRFLPASID